MLSRWIATCLRADTVAAPRRALHTTQICLKKRRAAQQDIEEEEDDLDEPLKVDQDLFAVSDDSSAADQSLRQQGIEAEQRAEARRTQIKRIADYASLSKSEKRAAGLLVTDKPIRGIVRDTTDEGQIRELKSVLKRWRSIGGVVSPETGGEVISRLKELHADVLAEEILASPTQYGIFNAASPFASQDRSTNAGPSSSRTSAGATRSFSTSARRMQPSSLESTKSCPSCSTPLPLSVSPCTSCSSLVPIPSDISFYQLFDLPGQSFDVEVRDLRSRFLRRQQKVHPDSFTGSDERTHAMADSQSSLLNKAYSTLADPLARAQYLLELNGDPIVETDSLTDPELLMDILDAREQLEEASTEEEMGVVRQANAERTKNTLANLSLAFAAHSPDIERAKILAIELQYLRNLENAAKDWAPGKRVEIKH